MHAPLGRAPSSLAHLVDRLGDVGHVGLVEPRDRDAAVERAVDGELIAHGLDLVLREARVRKHADLVRDVRPVLGGAVVRQRRFQGRAHGLDPVGHGLALARPALPEGRVAQHRRDDPRAVDRRARVHGPDDGFQLRLQTLGLVGRRADRRERADALAVQAKVLRVRLAEQDLVAVGDELPHRVRVALRVARREALVRAVEEDLEVLVFERSRQIRPLLGGRVDARRVVRARVEEHRGAGLGGQQIRLHALVVERRFGRLVEVAVAPDLDAGVAEDVRVITPRRLGHVADRFIGLARERRQPFQ
mmetsp:Transcript_1112/g.3307  ORF Transcript_1112/g.3307 Transcript_1112/m.3307 type:complete len:304 (+) Transcript_1112:21-932(+)